MYPLLDWGIPIILWLQNLGAWLDLPMAMFTFMGDEQFYLILLPVFVWWVDVGLGIRIGISLLLSAGINDALKLFAGLPRPYWVEASVRSLGEGASFGMPSGHSQTALVVWGRLAAWLRQRWASIALVALILLISISRLHLGVHYPSDLLGGWLVGGLLLWALIRFEGPTVRWLSGISPLRQVLIVALVSAGLLVVGGSAFAFRLSNPVSFPIPAHADPVSPNGFLTAAGTFFGMGSGAVLLVRWGRFRTNVGWPKRIGRYILGVTVLLGLYLGLSAIFPRGQDLVGGVFRFIRYALLGFWVLYLAPRTFHLLRLD